MNPHEIVAPAGYIREPLEAPHRIAILALNGNPRETEQRITSARRAARPEFQAEASAVEEG
jgi:hypothetical protein